MNCPICGNARCVSNTEDYRHNFDVGTLTDEYCGETVCMVCGSVFNVKITVVSKQSGVGKE